MPVALDEELECDDPQAKAVAHRNAECLRRVRDRPSIEYVALTMVCAAIVLLLLTVRGQHATASLREQVRPASKRAAEPPSAPLVGAEATEAPPSAPAPAGHTPSTTTMSNSSNTTSPHAPTNSLWPWTPPPSLPPPQASTLPPGSGHSQQHRVPSLLRHVHVPPSQPLHPQPQPMAPSSPPALNMRLSGVPSPPWPATPLSPPANPSPRQPLTAVERAALERAEQRAGMRAERKQQSRERRKSLMGRPKDRPRHPPRPPSSPPALPPLPPLPPPPPPPPPRPLHLRLNQRYQEGRPSNILQEAGVLLHQLDQTEDPERPWMPCRNGWCSHLSDRLSATFINAHGAHGVYFSDRGGFVLSPHHARIRCSHQSDMGSMDTRWSEYGGCNPTACSRVSPYTCSWPSDQLKEMLEMRSTGYNECVLDTAVWHAPEIIEAWFVMRPPGDSQGGVIDIGAAWPEWAWRTFRATYARWIPLHDFPLLLLDIRSDFPFSVYQQS